MRELSREVRQREGLVYPLWSQQQEGSEVMDIIWPKSVAELREIENTRDLTGTEAQDLRIRENMEDIDWEDMTFEEFEDMFEDRDPTEFL